MYKLIIFDWDGTLMDSEKKIVACLRATIETLQLENKSNDQLKNIIGLGMKESVLAIYPDMNQDQLKVFISEYKEQFINKNNTSSELFDNVHSMLNNLKEKGYLLAIATGKGRNGLNRILNETGLQDYFNSTRCAGETCSKPDPRMLNEILNELNISASQSLMVGDTVYDLEMANNAGVESIAITHGVHSLDRLLNFYPITNVSCISELNMWFNDLNNFA